MTLQDDTNAALAAERQSYADDIAVREAMVTSLTEQVQAGQVAIADLQARLAAYEVPTLRDTDGITLQAAINDLGQGATLKVVGSFGIKNLFPKSGMTLDLTEAVIRPAGPADYGFQVKQAGAEHVTFLGGDIGGFGRRGVTPFSGFTMKGGRVHDCGEMGVGFDGEGADLDVVTLDSVEIDRNGSAPYVGVTAAGVKFFHLRRSRLINPNIHDNFGNGAWWDWQSGEAEIIGGNISHNLKVDGKGGRNIFWEKCGAADGTHGYDAVYEGMLTVDGVTVQQAGDMGIFIVASKHARIRNCYFGGNYNLQAIVVRDDPHRLTLDKHGFVVSDVDISDSTNIYNGDKVFANVAGVTRS